MNGHVDTDYQKWLGAGQMQNTPGLHTCKVGLGFLQSRFRVSGFGYCKVDGPGKTKPVEKTNSTAGAATSDLPLRKQEASSSILLRSRT